MIKLDIRKKLDLKEIKDFIKTSKKILKAKNINKKALNLNIEIEIISNNDIHYISYPIFTFFNLLDHLSYISEDKLITYEFFLKFDSLNKVDLSCQLWHGEKKRNLINYSFNAYCEDKNKIFKELSFDDQLNNIDFKKAFNNFKEIKKLSDSNYNEFNIKYQFILNRIDYYGYKKDTAYKFDFNCSKYDNFDYSHIIDNIFKYNKEYEYKIVILDNNLIKDVFNLDHNKKYLLIEKSHNKNNYNPFRKKEYTFIEFTYIHEYFLHLFNYIYSENLYLTDNLWMEKIEKKLFNLNQYDKNDREKYNNLLELKIFTQKLLDRGITI